MPAYLIINGHRLSQKQTTFQRRCLSQKLAQWTCQWPPRQGADTCKDSSSVFRGLLLSFFSSSLETVTQIHWKLLKVAESSWKMLKVTASSWMLLRTTESWDPNCTRITFFDLCLTAGQLRQMDGQYLCSTAASIPSGTAGSRQSLSSHAMPSRSVFWKACHVISV